MSQERDRQRERNTNRSSRHDYLIKLSGVSSSTNKEDIKKLLHPCRVVNIHLFNESGSSSNECFVDLESENDVKDVMKKRNLAMGNRDVEISRSNVYEYNFFMKHKGMNQWQDPVLRLDGLPESCTMADVQIFFQDIEIARNGIYITRDMSDRAVGGGYVAFISMDNAYKAIDIYDQKRIEDREINLTSSSYDEAKKTITDDAYLNGKRFAGENDEEETSKSRENNKRKNQSERRSRSNSRDHRYQTVKRRRSSSNSHQSRSRRSRDNDQRRNRSRSPIRRTSPTTSKTNREYLIKMRGMPYTVTEDDIRKFFPTICRPVRIEILQNRRTNRPNGDGHVYFKSMDEINEAMKHDRKYMGSRYIELYFDSPRHSSSHHRRRSKSNDSHRQTSRSPSKPIDNSNNQSRSRSESPH